MIRIEDDGAVVFELYLPHADCIHVLGDFTGWEETPIAMLRQKSPEDGWWFARHTLTPGEYTFAYLVDGRSWLPDYAASGIRRNLFGRWTSVLNVTPPIKLSALPPMPKPVVAPVSVRSRPDREERVRIVDEQDVAREFSIAGLSAHLRTA